MSLETRLIEPVAIAELGCAVGLLFVQGAGIRVGVWSGEGLSHLSGAGARRLARHYEESEVAEALAPVSAALRLQAEKLGTMQSAGDVGHA